MPMTTDHKILRNSIIRRSFLSVILIAGVILTIMTFLGRVWWGFELATHFRVQYVIVYSFLTLTMLAKRQWVLFGVATTCTLIHLLAILPVYLSPLETPIAQPPDSIKILSSNVHGKNNHHGQILNLASRESPDVVVLQEVDGTWLQSLESLHKTHPHRLVAKSRSYERLALYSRYPIVTSQERHYGRYRVPILIATLNIKNHPLTIYAAHLTSPTSPQDAQARNQELNLIANEINSAKEPAILVGDLNITPWSPYFNDLIRNTGLKDSRNGFGIQASWPSYLLPFLIPLDHCLVDPSIQVRDRRLGPNIGSDHYPILLELALSGKSQGEIITTNTTSEVPAPAL